MRPRALFVEVVIAAVLAGALLVLAAGLGVVAVVAVPVLLILVLSLLVERLMRGRRRR